jgi:hypothetical protein
MFSRVLDLDLDFFMDDAVHFIPIDAPRPDPSEYTSWSVDDSLAYLRDRCRLSPGTPGVVVERHHEVFPIWRSLLNQGQLTRPFHVTHIDAHSDLGTGMNLTIYNLMTSVLFRPVDERADVPSGIDYLHEGSYLLYAIASRWISDLVYVHNEAGGNDVSWMIQEGFGDEMSSIQLAAVTDEQFHSLLGGNRSVERREPAVPFQGVAAEDYFAMEDFDFVCLARSPSYTTTATDEVFDAIRDTFIDEEAE